MGDQKQTKFRILAFDPSLTNTGWSLLEGSVDNGNLLVLKTGEIRPGPVADKSSYKEEVETFGKRTISLAILREEITKLLLELKPDFITSEDIYISMFRPMAYGALAMWICIAKMVCHDVVGKSITLIPTKICKQVCTGSGGNGKTTVQMAILASKRVTFKHNDDKTHMTEHQADSIAVGMAFAERYGTVIRNTLGFVS